MKTRVLLTFLGALIASIASIVTLQRFGWVSESQATALLSALIPLSGVFVTLLWSQKQFLHQLENERARAQADRVHQMKQQAFIAAAEAVLECINYLSTLPDRPLPKNGDTPHETTRFALALSKLHFCAELRTIETIIPLSRTLTVGLMDVTKAKLPSALTNEASNVVDSQIAFFQQQSAFLQEQILAAARQDMNHPMVAPLSASRQNAVDKLLELEARKLELIQQRSTEIEMCRDAALRVVRQVIPASLEFYLCARRELGNSIDENTYRDLMTQESSAALDAMSAFIAAIRNETNSRR